MKAFIADAEWSPKKEYPITEDEKKHKRAFDGSKVWRNPEFSFKDVSTPNIQDDEVLIRVKVCGVCGSDTHLYETDKDGYILFSGLTQLPCTLGHEFSGIIEKTGKNVTGLKKGDIVAVESVMWCGTCQTCRSGAFNQCKQIDLLGLSFNGAFAEHVVVKAKYCWEINAMKELFPEDKVFFLGALIEPVGCAYNGMFISGGGFMPGSTVVVYGAGPIGLGAVALAKLAGANLVIAFDEVDVRVELAKKMGADYAFNVNGLGNSSPSEKIMELTKGWGADVQVEAAGAAPRTLPQMERSMASQGKIVYVGRSSTQSPIHLDLFVTGANKIVGSRGHAGYGIFSNIIKLIQAGRLDLTHMITSQFHFDDALTALEKSADKVDGKIMINIS